MEKDLLDGSLFSLGENEPVTLGWPKWAEILVWLFLFTVTLLMLLQTTILIVSVFFILSSLVMGFSKYHNEPLLGFLMGPLFYASILSFGILF